MSVTAHYIGGPLDGQVEEIEDAPVRATMKNPPGPVSYDPGANVEAQASYEIVHYVRAERLHEDDVGGQRHYVYRLAGW